VIVKFAALEPGLLASNRPLPDLLEFDLCGKRLGVPNKLSNDRVLELLGDEFQRGAVLDLNDFRDDRRVRLAATEAINGIADKDIGITVPNDIQSMLQEFTVTPPSSTLPPGEDVLGIYDASPLEGPLAAGIKLTVEAGAIVLLIVSADATVDNGSARQRRQRTD